VDSNTRVASKVLADSFGAPVVIENVPGAGGVRGALQVVHAAPDGRTLGMVSNNHVINPSFMPEMPFDALNDITPITVVGSSQFALLVHPSVPAANVQELIGLLKQNPGKYDYASSGTGTAIQLAAELFLDQAGVEANHIPYRGTGQMMNDLIAGHVDFGFASLAPSLANVQSGALR